MSKQIFIRFHLGAEQSVDWLLYDTQLIDQGSLKPEQLYKLAKISKQTPAIIILPGQQVLHCRSELEGKPALALKALPYQLEEQLSSPIEALHLACSTPIEGRVSVNLIERTLLDSYIDQLTLAQIEIKACYADYQLLPDTQLCGWQENGNILIHGPNLGCSLDSQLFPPWWQQIVSEAPLADGCSTSNLQLDFYGDLAVIPKNCTQQPAVDNLLLLMAKHYEPQRSVNLLQGDYQPTDPLLNKLKLSLWPLTLLFLIAIACSLILYTENRQLAQQLEETRLQIKTEFRRSFPQARNLVRLRAQMQHQLSQLKIRYSQNSMLQLIDKTSPAIAESPVKTTRISYQAEKNSLTIQLTSPEASEITRLKKELEQTIPGITLTGAVKRGTHYESILTYKPAGAAQ